MLTTDNSEVKVELVLTLEYIRDLFIRNEDGLALQELNIVLQKMESIAQEMAAQEGEILRQLLLQSLNCLETKDYVQLADILIFEIKPFLKTERG
jgi:hypothetical protein